MVEVVGGFLVGVAILIKEVLTWVTPSEDNCRMSLTGPHVTPGWQSHLPSHGDAVKVESNNTSHTQGHSVTTNGPPHCLKVFVPDRRERMQVVLVDLGFDAIELDLTVLLLKLQVGSHVLSCDHLLR